MESSAIKRLMKDFQKLKGENDDEIIASPN